MPRPEISYPVYFHVMPELASTRYSMTQGMAHTEQEWSSD